MSLSCYLLFQSAHRMLLQLELDEDEAHTWKARLYEYRQRYLDCEMQVDQKDNLFISLVPEDSSDNTDQAHQVRKSLRQRAPRIVQADEWVSQPHALSTVDAKFLTDFCDLIKSKFTHVPQISGDYKVYLMMKFVPTGTPASAPHADLHNNTKYWTFTFNCNYDYESPPLFTTAGFDPPQKWKQKSRRKNQETWPLALGFDGTELHFAKEQTEEYKNCMFAFSPHSADKSYGLRFFVVLCPKRTTDLNIEDLSIVQHHYTFD
jgi:hypothetical protein